MFLKKEMIMDGIGRGFFSPPVVAPQIGLLAHRYDPRAAVERAAFAAFPEARGGDGDDHSHLKSPRLLEVISQGSLPVEATLLAALSAPKEAVLLRSDSESSMESDGDK
jgi:hypothetical protein